MSDTGDTAYKMMLEGLERLREEGFSWDNVAKILSDSSVSGETVTGAMVWRVMNEGMDSPKIRRMMGLAPAAIEVPPCPDCGEAHVKKTCSARRRDGRRRRAWAGTDDEAELVDRWLEKHGYRSLSQYVRRTMLNGQ